MKTSSLYFLFFVFLYNISCSEAGSTKKQTPKRNVAEIKFENEKIETGVSDGKTSVITDFKFWNTGDTALLITEARGNCHCVQGKFSEKGIEPGDSSVISVSFDPAGVNSLFIRTIMIHSNATRPAVELTISGEIKRDPEK